MFNLIPDLYEDTSPGFWEWDLGNRSEFFNPILKESLGYADDAFPNQWKYWRNLIYPKDWIALKSSYRKYLHGKFNKPYVHELRFKHKDGFTVYFLFIAQITKKRDNGMPLKIMGSHVDVTGQREANNKLTRAKRLLSKTSRISQWGGWELDMITNRLLWTDTTKNILELPGEYIPERGAFLRFVKHDEDKEKLLKLLNTAIALGDTYDTEMEMVTAKGKEIWARCLGQSEFENGRCIRVFGVVQDVTEQKLAQEKLLLKEEQLATFVKHSPAAISMLDCKMNYIAASDVWKDLFDLASKDIRGRNYYEIFPQTPEEWKRYHQRGLAGEVLKMDEDSFVLPDGKTEWLQWEVRPWYEKHGEVGGIVIFTAVVSEKRAYQDALIMARERAELSLQLKSKFLSVMSHEMRTPLNAVIGFINLLLRDPREDQLENMNVLKFSAENLLILINDILDFSKLEAGKVQLEQTDFNFKDLLNNIVTALRHEADAKELRLELITGNSIPHILSGDPSRLGQVITNLVSNAIKFTYQGTVSVISDLRAEESDTVTIGFKVVDTGIGIAAEKQEHIFEMFSQADSGTTRKYGGTGLGLTISRRILDIMGSEIRLDSQVGKGSVFSFEIAFRKSSQNVVSESVGEGRRDVLNGVKILIADDHPINVLVVKKFLENWHCECSVAANGSIALEMIQMNEYDAVLMDLQMPVMDGYEATRLIRELPEDKYKRIPIIAVSASPMLNVLDKLAEAGINDYITKPFKPSELQQKLTYYLNQRS
jgi:PAS domain S-box-containing protein